MILDPCFSTGPCRRTCPRCLGPLPPCLAATPIPTTAGTFSSSHVSLPAYHLLMYLLITCERTCYPLLMYLLITCGYQIPVHHLLMYLLIKCEYLLITLAYSWSSPVKKTYGTPHIWVLPCHLHLSVKMCYCTCSSHVNTCLSPLNILAHHGYQ